MRRDPIEGLEWRIDFQVTDHPEVDESVSARAEAGDPPGDVCVYGDLEKAGSFFPRSGFLPSFTSPGCTRLAVKLAFLPDFFSRHHHRLQVFRGVQMLASTDFTTHNETQVDDMVLLNRPGLVHASRVSR